MTDALATAMSVSVRVLPATEDEVSTRIRTADGRDMHYEEFLVRHGASPAVRSVAYAGATAARPAPGVLEAVTASDLLILGPSNPVASIGPIFAVPGLREAVRDSPADVVAVTPVVSAVPVAGTGEERRATSRAALLAAAGLPSTATAVAGLYRDLVARFVLDAADAEQADAIRALGVPVTVADTLLHRAAVPSALLAAVLRAQGSAALPTSAAPRR